MASSNGVISPKFVRHLYNLKKTPFCKACDIFDKKQVEPTNLEKMNVKRAVQIFSPPVTAALTYMDKYCAYTNYNDFSQTDATVQYMTNMLTFFKIHDVHDLTQHSVRSDPLNAPYTDLHKRLKWL